MKYRIVRYKSGRYGIQHKRLFWWDDERDPFQPRYRVSWDTYGKAADVLLKRARAAHAWDVSYIFTPQNLDNYCLRNLRESLEDDLHKNAQDIDQFFALKRAKILEKRL